MVETNARKDFFNDCAPRYLEEVSTRGTVGSLGRRPIDLDGWELMVVARRA